MKTNQTNLKKRLPYYFLLIIQVIIFIGLNTASGADKGSIFINEVNPAISAQLEKIGTDIKLVTLDQAKRDAILAEYPEHLNLDIPSLDGGVYQIELIKNRSLTGAIETGTYGSDGKATPFAYTRGAYYQGTVKGLAKSVVSFSFFSDNVMGFISGPAGHGNIVIGSIKDLYPGSNNDYVIYDDSKLNIKNPFVCEENGAASKQRIKQDIINDITQQMIVTKCVHIYFECDYAMYTGFGNNVPNVMNYVTAVFNEVATLYNNESISTVASGIYVWTSTDPYVGFANTGTCLPGFAAYRTSFPGDLAHLLSFRNLGGGRAYIDVLCNLPSAYAVSEIYNTFATFPTYSWTVMVITHETGHNLGSPHTHGCYWNGNNTAIDGCGPTYDIAYQEGACAIGPIPGAGGTMMSYCHLNGVGINFNLGFGTQPGNLIRSKVNGAACLTSCVCLPTISITKNPNTAICAGTSVTFTAATTSEGLTPTYQWKKNGSNAGTNSPTYTTTNLANGDQVKCELTSSLVCATGGAVTSNTLTMTVNPLLLPTISISGNSTICAGELASFSVSSMTNQGTPTIEWFLNNVSQGVSATFSSSSLANGDVVKAKLTSTALCATPASVFSNSITMTVHALPIVGIITTPDPAAVCEGYGIDLEGTGALTYCWDAGSGPSCGNPVVAVFPAGNYIVTVTGTDVNGCINTATVGLTFWALPTPDITTNTGTSSFCAGSSLILDAGSYDAWEWSIGATTQTIATNSGSTYTVTVTDNHGCTATDSETTIRVTSVPGRPGSIDGPVWGLCNTSGNVYSINPVSNTDSYLWTVSNGIITSGQGTTSIEVDYLGFSSSTITVKAVNVCGKSNSRSLTVYAKPATPLTIHGQKNGVCKKLGLFYSVDPVDGASNYKWTVPSGVTIVNGQGTTEIEVNFGNSFSSGSICCRAENSCGNSSYFCMNVHSKAQKPVIIIGPTSVCRHSTHTYSTPSVYGAASYLWSVPSGAVILSGQGTASIDVKFGTHSGQVEVWAKNSCGTSSDYDLNVRIVCRDASGFETGEVNAYPNPVHNNLNVSIPSDLNQKCVIKMIDVIGKQMMFDAIELTEGENLHQYDVSGYAQGLYFIVIEREGMPAETVRIIVD